MRVNLLLHNLQRRFMQIVVVAAALFESTRAMKQ